MRWFVVWLVFFLLTLFFGNFLLVSWHEAAHQQVFAEFGVDSRVELGFFGGKTIPLSKIPLDSHDTIYFLHGLNEVVGYTALAFFNAIVMTLFSIVFVWKIGKETN